MNYNLYYDDDKAPALILISPMYVEQIEYHSLLAVDNEVLMKGSEGTVRVDVKAALGTETLAPSATLNKVDLHAYALSTWAQSLSCYEVVLLCHLLVLMY